MDILDGLDMDAHALVDVRIEATQRVAMCATQVLDDLPSRSIRSYSQQAIRSRRSSSSHHPIEEIQNHSAHAAMLPANQSGSPNLTGSRQILEVGGLVDRAAEVRPGHERRRSLTGDDDVPSDVPSKSVLREDEDPMDREAAETSGDAPEGDARGDGRTGGGTAAGATADGVPSINDEGHGDAQSGDQEVPTDGSPHLHQAAEPEGDHAETAACAEPEPDCAERAVCAPCQEDECELQMHLTLASLQQQQPVEMQLNGGPRDPDGPIDLHDSHRGSLASMQEEGMQAGGDSAVHLAIKGRTGTLVSEAAATLEFPADTANKGMAAAGVLIDSSPLSRAETVADPPSGPDPDPEADPPTDPEVATSSVSIREDPVPAAPAVNNAPAPGDVSIAPSLDLAPASPPASPPAPEGEVDAPSPALAPEACPNQHPNLTGEPMPVDDPMPVGDDVRTTEEDEAGGLTAAPPISGGVHSGPSASSLVGSESQRLGTLPDTYCGDLPELRREANRIHKGGWV